MSDLGNGHYGDEMTYNIFYSPWSAWTRHPEDYNLVQDTLDIDLYLVVKAQLIL